MGYVPLGIACGILAQKVGVSAWEIGVMSLMVFAGSGQFIALAMIGSGVSIFSVVITTFIVNLRHVLYSSSLAPFILHEGKRYLMCFGQGITDETFAMNLNAFNHEQWSAERALVLNILAHLCWIGSNVVGNLLGNIIAIDIEVAGYALTAMLIGLWAFCFGNWLLICTGVFAGILGLVLSQFLANKLHIVAATLIAATLGCMLEGGAGSDKRDGA